jgi:hypothetical protein
MLTAKRSNFSLYWDWLFAKSYGNTVALFFCFSSLGGGLRCVSSFGRGICKKSCLGPSGPSGSTGGAAIHGASEPDFLQIPLPKEERIALEDEKQKKENYF